MSTTRRDSGMTPFLLRLPHLVPPADDAIRTERDRALVDAYLSAVNHAPLDGTPASPATEQEFFTQASILDAAKRAIPRERLWITFDDHSARNGRGITAPVFSIRGKSFGSTRPISQTEESSRSGDLWQSRTLHDALAVPVVLCSMHSPVTPAQVMARQHALGQSFSHVRLLGEGRSGIVTNFPTVPENDAELVRVFGWSIARENGWADTIVVSANLRATRQMRVWIVGGEVVAGSGIVPALDPRDAGSSAFDQRNTHKPYDGIPITYSEPHEVEYIAELARTISAAGKNGGDLPASFVLDIGWSNGVPAVLDIRSLDETPLYAVDPYRIISALDAA